MKTACEILQAALRKEKQAHDFYDGLFMHCKTDVVKQLIEKLRDEEGRHVAMIEMMIKQVSSGQNHE